MTKRKSQADSGRKKSADERGRLLRDFRKVYGVTLEEMAKLIGLSQPMLTRFETGTRNLSADAWARLLIAMGKIGKKKGAERKTRFDELQKQWMKNLLTPFSDSSAIEAEQQRIVEEDKSSLELSKAIAGQLPEFIPEMEKDVLASILTHIRKNPEKGAREYLALLEWRQKILDLEKKGYALMPKSVEEERDQLKARVAELEQELKAYQELLPQSTRRIEELEQELARERANKGSGDVTITPDVPERKTSG